MGSPAALQNVKLNQMLGPRRQAFIDEAVSKTRRVPCPAGSLLLWDSRTIHQGWSGGSRLAQPICLEPKWGRSEAARLQKLFACAAGLQTAHSSSEVAVQGARGPCPTKVPYCVAPGLEDTWR